MSFITITNDNFEQEVMQSDVPVLVDFWAPWCGPCKMVAPIVEEVADEVQNAKVGKINVDDNPDLSAKYRVMSIPTLAVFKDGKIVKRSVGAASKAEILQMLE